MEVLKTLIFMTVLFLIFIFFWSDDCRNARYDNRILYSRWSKFFLVFFLKYVDIKALQRSCRKWNNAIGLYAIVKELCGKANLPIPKIYIIKDNTPNAFPTGRNPQNATVAVIEGLLNLLTIQEIKGVIVHELSHVKHYDILTSSIAAVIAGLITILANFAKFSALSNSKSNRPNAILTIITVLIMPIVAT